MIIFAASCCHHDPSHVYETNQFTPLHAKMAAKRHAQPSGCRGDADHYALRHTHTILTKLNVVIVAFISNESVFNSACLFAAT